MLEHEISISSPTGRLQLVPPDAACDEIIAQLRVHPDTRRYLRFFPTKFSIEDARTLREARAADPDTMNFNVFQTDGPEPRFVGTTGIFHINARGNGSCEAGIIIHPDFYGRGYATEILYIVLKYAFETKSMHRVAFDTGADNIPMNNWFEKVAGVRLEGRSKECWKNIETGEYTDVNWYAIIDWEWRDQVKKRLEQRLKVVT